MSIAVEPEATRLTATIGDKEISFETGAVAKQAHGAVLVQQEGTVVLATAVGRTEGREGADFFPLTVDVEEKTYAAGKIPGGFFKREGRAGEKAILTARMVDRPIRPLWPKGYKNEVQVIVTTFSADQVHPHDILAINGSSAALMLSPMPFLGPVGAVRIGRIDGQLVVNPTLPDLKDSTLDLIVCGTPRGDHDGRGRRPGDRRGGPDRRRSSSPTARSRSCASSRSSSPRRPACPSGSTAPSPSRCAATHGAALAAGDRRGRPRPRFRARSTRCSAGRAAGEIGGTRPTRTCCSASGCSSAFAQLGTEAREAAVYPHVKEQFGDAIRALTDAEQDSKELKSAKRHALYRAHRRRRSGCRSRPAATRRRRPGAARRRHPGRGRWLRATSSTRRSCARRSRSTSAGPTGAPRPRSGRSPRR